MKFIDLVEDLRETSPAAVQAKERGLVHLQYGVWGDPQTGEPVARTVNGQLVRIDKSDPSTAQTSEPAAKVTPPQPARSPDTGMTAPDDMDSDDDSSAEIEPEMHKGLGKLLSAAGGDTMKLRKTLANRYHAAGEDIEKKAKAVFWIAKLDAYEKEQSSHAQQAIDTVAARKAADLQAKKAKYPNPYKDL